MQKLSSELVKRILGAGLTQSELANLLQISRIQDSSGRVIGLSYKYTTGILAKCNQTFYNSLEGLKNKKFIETSKDNRLDIDVKILNNDFSNNDFSKGYINLQMKIFNDRDFYKLSSNEMAMALDLLRKRYNADTSKQGIPAKDLIEEYKKIFHVTERTVRRYLQHLRRYFYINCSKHKYFFKLKEMWNIDKSPRKTAEEEKYRSHIAQVACKRAKVANPSISMLKDLKTLIKQYRVTAEEQGKDISRLIINAVTESIKRYNELIPKPKWKYVVSLPYVHSILRESLNLI